jgi:hypothetical protein
MLGNHRWGAALTPWFFTEWKAQSRPGQGATIPERHVQSCWGPSTRTHLGYDGRMPFPARLALSLNTHPHTLHSGGEDLNHSLPQPWESWSMDNQGDEQVFDPVVGWGRWIEFHPLCKLSIERQGKQQVVFLDSLLRPKELPTILHIIQWIVQISITGYKDNFSTLEKWWDIVGTPKLFHTYPTLAIIVWNTMTLAHPVKHKHNTPSGINEHMYNTH